MGSGIELIDKITPKDGAFTGMVDEKEVIKKAVTTVTGATYTILTDDFQVDLNRVGVIAVTIDDDNKVSGRSFFIGDAGENAQTYNHTVTPETGTIMGETSASFAANGEQWELYWSVTANEWRIR